MALAYVGPWSVHVVHSRATCDSCRVCRSIAVSGSTNKRGRRPRRGQRAALMDFAEYRIHDRREAVSQPALGRPASRRTRIPHALGGLTACFSPLDGRRFLRTSSARFLSSRQGVPRTALQGSTKIRRRGARPVPSNPIDGTSWLNTAESGPSDPTYSQTFIDAMPCRNRENGFFNADCSSFTLPDRALTAHQRATSRHWSSE